MSANVLFYSLGGRLFWNILVPVSSVKPLSHCLTPLALNIRPCCYLRHGFSAGLIFGVYQLRTDRGRASNERNRRKR